MAATSATYPSVSGACRISTSIQCAPLSREQCAVTGITRLGLVTPRFARASSR